MTSSRAEDEHSDTRCHLPLMPTPSLDAKWPGLWHFVWQFETRVRVKWLNGGCSVEMNDGVELPGQDRVEVVAEPLGLGLVDHADSPLQPRFHDCFVDPTSVPEIEHEI